MPGHAGHLLPGAGDKPRHTVSTDAKTPWGLGFWRAESPALLSWLLEMPLWVRGTAQRHSVHPTICLDFAPLCF